jgi:hypothetical protein
MFYDDWGIVKIFRLCEPCYILSTSQYNSSNCFFFLFFFLFFLLDLSCPVLFSGIFSRNYKMQCRVMLIIFMPDCISSFSSYFFSDDSTEQCLAYSDMK